MRFSNKFIVLKFISKKKNKKFTLKSKIKRKII
jgi:hypothetical protein